MINIEEKELRLAVAKSISIRNVARELGMNPDNIKPIKRCIIKYGISTSHFTGKLWNKGRTLLKEEDIACKKRRNKQIKSFLFKSGRKEYKCDKCGISKWFGEDIKLEIHHIDGDKNNNLIDNLQILCPNCHSQTDNFRGRNIKKKERVPDNKIVFEYNKNNKNIRKTLIAIGLAPKGANYARVKRIIGENL